MLFSSDWAYKNPPFIFTQRGRTATAPFVLGPVHSHFMIEYGDFALIRERFYLVNNMKELFRDIEVNIILFFKAMDLYLEI